MPFPVVPALIALGVTVYAMTQKKKRSSTQSDDAPPVSHDLEADITKAMNSKDPAFILSVYDQVRTNPAADHDEMLYAKNQLMAKVNTMQPTANVNAGRSGRAYKLLLKELFPDGIRMYDVFTPAGARILRFSQLGGDLKSRKFIMAADGVDPGLLTNAKTDFLILQ